MKKLALSLAVGAASLLSLGAAIVPTAAQAQAVISVRVAPPPPRFEPVPPPRKGYIWSAGHYEWVGNRYAWRSGVWVRERPGYVYHAPQWQQRDGRWAYRAGGWDDDHDGVPNRWDRHPENPNRS